MTGDSSTKSEQKTDKKLTEKQKKLIDMALKKIISEYGEVLKKLSKD